MRWPTPTRPPARSFAGRSLYGRGTFGGRAPGASGSLSHASNNHQLYNAQVVQKAGKGEIILDANLTPHGIANFLSKTIDPSPARPGAAVPGAAARLAAYLTSGFS